LLREGIHSSGDLEIASARDEVTRERGQNGRERETNNEENFKKKHKNENFALLPKRIDVGAPAGISMPSSEDA
jgi:hypothetical protein